ncbi:Speract receptor [Bienertia sinuspersici]
MVDELSDKWKKTSLIDAEEEALVWDDEPDGLMDELVAHSLALKLITESPFNSEALKNIMKNLWKLTKGLVAREIKNNIFIFQFFSKLDREKVMDQGTWSFDGAGRGAEQANKRSSSSRVPSETKKDSIVGPSALSTDITKGEMENLLDDFKGALDDCELQDIGYMGSPFTWWNGQEGDGGEKEAHELSNSRPSKEAIEELRGVLKEVDDLLPMVESDVEDELMRHYTKNGSYTARLGYHFVRWYNGGLSIRISGVQVCCASCKDGVEDELHAVFTCPSMGFNSRRRRLMVFLIVARKYASFMEWWNVIVKMTNEDELCKVGTIVGDCGKLGMRCCTWKSRGDMRNWWQLF